MSEKDCKTALVTGSRGFIGRHFVAELQRRGWHVEEYDLKTGDDALKLFRWRRQRYELVVHCAAHVGGRAAIDDHSNMFFAKNLQLDAAMFDWAVKTGQGRVLYFSSSAAYPVGLQGKDDPFEVWEDQVANTRRLTEDDISLDLDGPTPCSPMPDANYGWAKITGERMARDARAAGLKVTVCRPFSGYGEDQDPDEYPFPAIVRRVLQGDMSVWGPAGSARDWVHVSDVVAGALAVVDSDTEEPVNLCTGKATTMGELARLVAATAGRRETAVRHMPDMPTGVFFRVGDPTRMLQHYTPQVSLKEGIERAVNAVKVA